MKRFVITYKKAYKRAEQDCTVYALTELQAVVSFKLTRPLCTIINIEEG
jgi:hypothetical protein